MTVSLSLSFIIATILVVLLLAFLFIREYRKHKSVKKKYSTLESDHKDMKKKYRIADKRNKELTTMFLSDRALCTYRNLRYDKHNFNITYEVEIKEMTKKKARIKPISFRTESKKMSDPKHKQMLLDYVDDTWVNLNDLEYILDDDAIKRDIRLEKILA